MRGRGAQGSLPRFLSDDIKLRRFPIINRVWASSAGRALKNQNDWNQ